jgi:hypothetical protein
MKKILKIHGFGINYINPEILRIHLKIYIQVLLMAVYLKFWMEDNLLIYEIKKKILKEPSPNKNIK